MDALDALGGVNPPVQGSRDGFSDLTSEQFTKIMFTELGHQDPLEPQDSKALLDQVSSLRSIQADMDLQSKLGDLVAQNEFASAAGLIGDYVVGLNDRLERVGDFVQSVSKTDSGPVLNLTSGDRLPMGNIEQIIDGALVGDGGGG